MTARRTLLPLVAAAALAAAATSTASASTDDATAVIGAGTLVDGIDLSGQTIAQGAATLQAQLTPKLLAPVTVHIGAKRFQLGGARAGVKLDALRTARRAYIAARDAAAPPATATPVATSPTKGATTTTPAGATRGGAVSGVSVPVALSLSRSKVKAWAAKVAPRVTRQPRSASLQIGLTKMVVHSASRGVTVDAGALAKQVGDAFADPSIPRDGLRLPLRPLEPSVTVASLRAANGTILTVDRDHFRLRLFKNLRLSKTYPIAIGMEGLDTPSGTYSIADKQVDPAWHVPNSAWAGSLAGQVIPGGAADNPLKARWMGIYDGVGIHGTSEDWSIGSRASHGCIRMHVSDVEDLYPRVPVGTKVLIR